MYTLVSWQPSHEYLTFFFVKQLASGLKNCNCMCKIFVLSFLKKTSNLVFSWSDFFLFTDCMGNIFVIIHPKKNLQRWLKNLVFSRSDFFSLIVWVQVSLLCFLKQLRGGWRISYFQGQIFIYLYLEDEPVKGA